ncbi:MAG TPA: DUF1338 domain-containing protein, partial [Candidatus Binatia bacterium]|nr:DUF1338 domain-containing protein [Candidatus Binatia bacterium]
MTDIRTMLDRLWDDYARLNPRAKAVHDLLTARGERVVNDHIAFRTFDLSPIALPAIAAHFTARGYTHGGDYDIAEKHATAVHLEPPEEGLPKVFVSELRTGECSPALRAVALGLAGQVPDGAVADPAFL